MVISPLSELNPGSRNWTVQVYVSRLWLHRGASDDGPIKHIGIVFQDKEVVVCLLVLFIYFVSRFIAYL